MIKKIDILLQTFEESLKQETFVKLILVAYNGAEVNLKKILIRKILIKKEHKISFTYRYQTKDIVKNYVIKEALEIIKNNIGIESFRLANLYTTEIDIYLEYTKNKKVILKNKPPSILETPSLNHNNKKNRKIEPSGKQYLHDLGITNQEGQVYKSSQGKYKQINHYIEILSSLLQNLPNREVTNVVDMGAGKGYLTFALYDYLNNVLKKPASITGLEYRKDLVELCNKVAKKSSFNNLQFVEGEIEKYNDKNFNVLIALHACDTATDDAIAKAIQNNADLIVVAPCCHKQIRREIEKHKASNELDFLTKHGIFLEKQAEMVTDGIRTLIIEYFGYDTKVVEFISDAHTHKNVLVIGEKKENKEIHKEDILNKIKSIKSFFGIEYHHLERTMKL